MKGLEHMDRTEPVELTILCLLYRGNEILLQNRVKADWKGYTIPGGHLEPKESFVDCAIREMKEETGLDVPHPKLCGIKQFTGSHGRYVVALFKSDEFYGELCSSEEGEMRWVDRDELDTLETVADLKELLSVFDDDNLSEFQYIDTDNGWLVSIK